MFVHVSAITSITFFCPILFTFNPTHPQSEFQKIGYRLLLHYLSLKTAHGDWNWMFLCVYSTMSWPAEVVQSKCYHFDHDAYMKSPLPSRTLSPPVTYFSFYTQPSAPSVSNESSCENIWLVFVCLKPTPSALLDIKGFTSFVKWFFFSNLFRPYQLYKDTFWARPVCIMKWPKELIG